MTLAQKLLARASGQAHVQPGDIVVVNVDLAMAHDSSGPRRWKPHLEALGAAIWDPSRVVIVSDHYVPAVDGESAAILKLTRDFAAAHQIDHFFDMEGICHAIMPEKGLLKPGIFVAGGDSHTPHAGAFGCYAAGFGATDMLGIVVTGQTWTIVPETIRVELEGRLPNFVSAKDIMLYLCRTLGMDNAFKAIEYGGSGVTSMSMDERMVLSNMAAELGGEVGLIAADATTLAHIRAHGGTISQADLVWQPDLDATYERRVQLDLATLSPQIARPHSPANSGAIEEVVGQEIHQAYIGACVGAKLEDLHMAARILKGRKIAKGVRLLVAPASSRVTEQAASDGTLASLMAAGATLLPSGCGACAGMGAGLLAEGEVCISTTNRNFKGRMGHGEAFVYLGSPYTVAASALTGRITDPRRIDHGTEVAA
ncbi:2,3-dimethylmalate dehydratase large subunit [Candidatus Phycosocius bacilliformis]|uniref:2,3-dimethylmalate dehydratase large subunit n=2 Tax=Candidatus Phycosocius bacilliformis TaxID=1445552 RepID=A0A2P2EDR7_9PROT|nr:2,3-dimethylmalate dehydratase large subunit [Candidatus Phycosocius bacilliformis]